MKNSTSVSIIDKTTKCGTMDMLVKMQALIDMTVIQLESPIQRPYKTKQHKGLKNSAKENQAGFKPMQWKFGRQIHYPSTPDQRQTLFCVVQLLDLFAILSIYVLIAESSDLIGSQYKVAKNLIQSTNLTEDNINYLGR